MKQRDVSVVPVSRARPANLVVVAALGAAVLVGPMTSAAVRHDGGNLLRPVGAVNPAVVERRQVGTSVRGRPIWAFRLGRAGQRRAVVIGSMHGDEPAGTRMAWSLIEGPKVRGVDMWVVPTVNPDGLRAGRRKNAHGVDLNRNWRHRWKRLWGSTNSGPRPFSEPETRAMRRFLNTIDPRFVVSFHQPLHGVDTYRVKDPALSHRLARRLGLPKKSFACGGICHGTMTGWFNSRHRGAAVTVEFGRSPSKAYLTGRARRGTLRSLFGFYP